MFRPWSQDPRPIWRVRAAWATSRSLDARDRELLLETLNQTGHVRAATLAEQDGDLTLTMLIRARSRKAAEVAAAYITEVAFRVAGLDNPGKIRARAIRPVPRSWALSA